MQNWELSKDGKNVCYDMSQMIEKEVFRSLKDIDIFIDTCTVLNDTPAGADADEIKIIFNL